VVAVVLATGGDPGGGSSTSASGDSGERTTRSSGRSTGTSTQGSTATPTQGSTSAPAPAGAPTTPAAAVRAFYGRAAAHRYDDAWALAAPGLRGQLGGFDAFRRQFSTVRSIVFSRADTVREDDAGATVALATTATHTDRVDHCTGTAETAPAPGGGWLVSHIAVSC
jgi:hypothetical protein